MSLKNKLDDEFAKVAAKNLAKKITYDEADLLCRSLGTLDDYAAWVQSLDLDSISNETTRKIHSAYVNIYAQPTTGAKIPKQILVMLRLAARKK